MKWEGFIKLINAYTERETERENQEEWRELMKATLKVPRHSFLLGRFPPPIFF